MKIILDERETHLYAKMTTLNANANITKQVLPLGDILLQKEDNTDFVLIERKTFADLLASIKDGRYKEQSHRLKYSSGIQPHNIIYIIEGILSQVRTPQDRSKIFSTMTTLQIFKGFSVVRTSSLDETADFILSMSNKIDRELKRGNTPWSQMSTSTTAGENNMENVNNVAVAASVPIENGENVANYCHVVKKVKKENITPENIGEIFLCQIPHVSTVSAVTIMQRFKTISNLIKEIEKDPHVLDNMECSSKGKTRKLSKLVIKNIIEYLL